MATPDLTRSIRPARSCPAAMSLSMAVSDNTTMSASSPTCIRLTTSTPPAASAATARPLWAVKPLISSASTSRAAMEDSNFKRRGVMPLILKRVVDPREDGHPLGSVADVHVSHHRGSRDAAYADAHNFVQVCERVRAGAREHPSQVQKRRDFNIDMTGCRIKAKGPMPQLDDGSS